jgi:hypothetical protein
MYGNVLGDAIKQSAFECAMTAEPQLQPSSRNASVRRAVQRTVMRTHHARNQNASSRSLENRMRRVRGRRRPGAQMPRGALRQGPSPSRRRGRQDLFVLASALACMPTDLSDAAALVPDCLTENTGLARYRRPQPSCKTGCNDDGERERDATSRPLNHVPSSGTTQDINCAVLA